MAQVINTNVSSLNSQRHLNNSSNALADTTEKLSSGMRINSASDDAAGMQIADRFTSQIDGLDQASRNANDGISLAQTAEGAMEEVTNNLQRIRELSVQAANDTNSEDDLASIQSEIDELTEEINRVANQTDFNGTKLLDGSFSGALFQVGADSGQTIQIGSIADSNTDVLGDTTFSSGTSTITAATSGVTSGVATASGLLTGVIVNYANADGTSGTLTLDDIEIEVGDDVNEVIAQAFNAQQDITGVHASIDDSGNLQLESIIAGRSFTTTAGASSGSASTLAAVTSAQEASVQMNDIDVSDYTGAARAIEIVDAALSEISASRGELGAVQNRFDSTVASLSTTSENLSSARSRIQDTDYASETAELSRTQILQEAGTSMLAQANSSTETVLTLLQQ
jgi:flagellin